MPHQNKIMNENNVRIKICPKCRATFECSTDGNCWCSKLPNIMPFKENGECLCPVCLEKIIKEQIEQVEKTKTGLQELKKKL